MLELFLLVQNSMRPNFNMSNRNSEKSPLRRLTSEIGDTKQPLIRTMPVRMSALSASSNVTPLSDDEIRLADRAARRIYEHVRSFVESLPADARNASGMSRFLDVDRTTCQRLVFTASRPYCGLSLVDRLPGVRGLRQLIGAARSNGGTIDDDAIHALEIAVDRFDEVLRTLGGSQSAVIRRIAATTQAAPAETQQLQSDEPGAARERLFQAAAELTGRYSETWIAVYVYSPETKRDDGMIGVARAHGLVGHHARPDAVPLTFHNFISRKKSWTPPIDPSSQEFRNLQDERTIGNSPDAILREFCTDPLPVVSSRQPGEYLVQAIDTDPSVHNQPVDFMLATRNAMPHPASQHPRIEEVWAMINFPVRQMVFDVYMHRDLARQCIPSLDAHLWRPDFAAQVGDRWQTRFADSPRLELLGQGLSNSATAAYNRQTELTEFLFNGLQLDPNRFVAYRCAVRYPLWRTGYCMSFDFNTSDDDD